MRISDEWAARWVSAAVASKRCDEAAAAALSDTLTRSLNTIYKAVAFDIDGTLTPPDATELDPQARDLLARLLRRGCHVWLVTGRGSSVAMTVGRELATHTDLEPDEWLRLRCVSHNGALVQFTDPLRPDVLLGAEETLLPGFDTTGERALALREEVADILRTASITTRALSIEPGRGRPAVGVRIVFHDPAARDQAAGLLASTADAYGLDLRRGSYSAQATIDITSADKARGLAALAAQFALDPDSVLRVGDQGHPGGTDETFLATAAGFTVDTISASPHGCFPVVDPDGNILGGVEATQHLVESLSIAAPLRIQVPPGDYRETLLPRLREFEQAAVTRADTETRMIERQLSVRVAQLVSHDPGAGDFSIRVADLFDRRSGGVHIHEWDLTELADHEAVCRLFQFDALDRASEHDAGPTRSMYTDSGILLRGPDYYMHLTGRRGPEHIGDYLTQCAAFVADALAALTELRATRPTPALVQIALAIEDNVRDIVLTLLNVALFNAQPPFDPDTDPPTATAAHLVATIGDIAGHHTRAYVDLLLEPHKPWPIALEECEKPLHGLAAWLAENAASLEAETTRRSGCQGWADGSKATTFRWRESDDIIQNISAVVMGLRAIARRPAEETSDPILAVGLQYGGLELPLLAAAIGPRFGLHFKPAAMRVSMYGNGTQGEEARADLDAWVASADDADFPVIALGTPHDGECTDACTTDPAHVAPERLHPDVVVFDDNCTTSTTMQAARDMLIRRGCDVRAVVIVRFPGANRAAQMAMEHHGHLDVDLAHNFVHGLVGPSPYSRLVLPHPTGNPYEDENGVFDKAKLRIQLLLHKNSPHQYSVKPLTPWGLPAE